MKTLPRDGHHILIADGNDGRRLEWCAWALQEGHAVIEAREAKAAVSHATARAPALIVLTLELVGSDGISTCLHLKALPDTMDLPVLLAVPDDPRIIERAFEAGADDVIILPVHPHIFKRRVRLLSDAARQRDHITEIERRASQIFHENRAAMLMIDPRTGNIVDVNRAACAFYGFARADFLKKHFTDLDAPQISPDYALQTTNLVMRHQLANGEIRDVSVFSGPVEINGQKHVCMIVFDVTKRKLAELAEHHQRTLANALRENAATLVSTLDHEEVLDRILNALNDIVPFKGATIMRIDGDVTTTLRVTGYADQGTEAAILNDLHFPIAHTDSFRTVIEFDRPLVVHDVQQMPGWVPVRGLEWVRAHITVPIRHNRRTIGFLNVDSPIPYQYSDVDAERLQAFADQAAIAINNAQIYHRLADQAADLEILVSERTAELFKQRAQLSAILDTMTEGVFYGELVDDEGNIDLRYISRALEDMTGYQEDELLHRSLDLLRPPDVTEQQQKKLYAEVLLSLSKRGKWQAELKVMRKDGSTFTAACSVARLQQSDGASFGVVGVLRDISQEKALAEQKSRFVAHASHELRTPLTNVKTRLYLMRKQPDKLDEHLSVLEHVTSRMRRLVEDLLDLSRFEHGMLELRIQETNLNLLLREVASLQQAEAEARGIQLVYESPSQQIVALADAERLTQVITNLVVNAINYSDTGSVVALRLYSVRGESLATSPIAIEVEDHGIGIAPEHISNIFQPFFRVPSEIQGTGLGLSIAREIVQLHGGDITVTSALGVGSIFRVLLPQAIVNQQFTPALTEAEA